MNESHDPEKAEQSGKVHLKAAAEDLKAAAAGKIENLRQTADQKTDEFRKATSEKAKEASSVAEQVWSSAAAKGQNWLAEGEAYIRKNPAQAVLIALGVGIFVGMSLRKP
jgi:ElaB/YqjD/DUF883 family membrane-anchored ribosome-binding protein